MNQVRVRDARPDDLHSVAQLLKEAYGQYSILMPVDAWQSYLQDIMDVEARLSESQLIVADVDGRLSGAVTLYLKGSDLSWPAGWAGIRLLGVHPDGRGKGVGRALMDECIRRSRVAGLKAVGLHTTTAMDVGRRLYERMGFVRVPEFDFHPSEDVVVMAYCLDIAS